MPDFRELLKRPAGKGKKPPVLPAADYPGIVKAHEMGVSTKKKTPYVRFHLGLTGWPDEVEESSRMATDGEGQSYPIDLSKKQFRTDFYFTDDSIYRLDEFLKSCGIDPAGRTYEECIQDCQGKEVVVQMIQKMNEESNEEFNEVKKVVGTGS